MLGLWPFGTGPRAVPHTHGVEWRTSCVFVNRGRCAIHAVLTPYPELLTVREVAEILRVDCSYVCRLIRVGRLPVLRPTPHKTRVLKTDLSVFLATARVAGCAATTAAGRSMAPPTSQDDRR